MTPIKYVENFEYICVEIVEMTMITLDQKI